MAPGEDRFCPKCGTPRQPGMSFCGRCGASFDVPRPIGGATRASDVRPPRAGSEAAPELSTPNGFDRQPGPSRATGTELFLVLAILVCGAWAWFNVGPGAKPASTPAAAATARPSPTVGKYTQTWTKSYATTTCQDWSSAMDGHQQFVMAGDMLTAHWNSQGANRLPPDATITAFASAIGTVCTTGAEAGIKVAEVAASLLFLSSDLQP